MYYVPRGGNRGGADNFKWEDVKEDKGRECYLGHSLMAPVGRWQKNKDLQWFSKERQKDAGTTSFTTEIQAAHNAEREAMLIALGQKVGDRLAAEAMQPQKELDHRKFKRQQSVKQKRKEKPKKNKKERDASSKRKLKHKHKKEKKRRKHKSSSEESESSSSSDSDSIPSRSNSDEDNRGHKRHRKDNDCDNFSRDVRKRYHHSQEKDNSKNYKYNKHEDYKRRERRSNSRDYSRRKYDDGRERRRK